MSESSHWELTPEEIAEAVIRVPIGEWQTPYAAKAQYLKLAYGIVDWMSTHETDGSPTSGGRSWSARLVEELETGGYIHGTLPNLSLHP